MYPGKVVGRENGMLGGVTVRGSERKAQKGCECGEEMTAAEGMEKSNEWVRGAD